MSLLRRTHARHARPSRTVPLLLAGGLTATLGLAEGVGARVASASPDPFAQLRACESGGNYASDTGNGFYGAYQFDLGTWHGLGLGGRPSDAAPAVQDAAARTLQAQRGWSPWPACSRRLGLGRVAAPASRSRSLELLVRPAAMAAPAFTGHVFTVADQATERPDVVAWQRRMAQRGWPLAVDGEFGPQSAGVAARFAAEKGLHPTAFGTVDAAVFAAAWTAPVS